MEERYEELEFLADEGGVDAEEVEDAEEEDDEEESSGDVASSDGDSDGDTSVE